MATVARTLAFQGLFHDHFFAKDLCQNDLCLKQALAYLVARQKAQWQ